MDQKMCLKYPFSACTKPLFSWHDMSYNNRSNYTLKHLEERVKVYSTQEFNYDIVPVKLKS